MGVMHFKVLRRGEDPKWVIHLNETTYGRYPNIEKAIQNGQAAARSAQQQGHEARLSLQDHASNPSELPF